MRSHGKYHGLFVYSAPLLEGEPYVASLMSPEGEPPLLHRLQTTRDLAPIFSRLSCAGTKPLSPITIITNHIIPNNFVPCDDDELQPLIDRCMRMIHRHASLVGALPTVLAHADLTSLNILIDPPTGRVTGILDWDSATYERLGYNLHFAEHLFGYMTLTGWEDNEDREKLEQGFYETFYQSLSSQGIEVTETFRLAVEVSKAVGILGYYSTRMESDNRGLYEKYLVDFLKRFSWEREDDSYWYDEND